VGWKGDTGDDDTVLACFDSHTGLPSWSAALLLLARSGVLFNSRVSLVQLSVALKPVPDLRGEYAEMVWPIGARGRGSVSSEAGAADEAETDSWPDDAGRATGLEV